MYDARSYIKVLVELRLSALLLRLRECRILGGRGGVYNYQYISWSMLRWGT